MFLYTPFMAFMLIGAALTDSTPPIVNLGYIQVEGNTGLRESFSTDVFYGIRYAQPPVGNLRWKAPLNIEARSPYRKGTLVNATTPAPECVQGLPAWAYATYESQISLADATIPDGQEDCLTLDVYVPTNPVSQNLPVLFMIHGGGYVSGNSYSNPGYAMTNVSQGNIIFVSTQYRLGAFGFLGSSEVIKSGTANAGLLDQRSALGWVQRHIAAFGGDPTKVTITGGSAGGGSVMDQMLLNGAPANPPFRAVISEYPYVQSFKSDKVLEAQYRQLLAQTNCTNIQCLRSVDTTSLMLATQQSYILGYIQPKIPLYGFGDFYYGPAIDGKTMTDFPSKLLKEGKFTNVPLMVDHDIDEGYVFTNETITTESAVLTDLQQLFPVGNAKFFNSLLQLYNISDFAGPFWQLAQIFGDYTIDCVTYYMASATSQAGLPTYKLNFGLGGGLHAATFNYLYGFDYGSVDDLIIADIMKSYWISFVVALDPNALSFTGSASPFWNDWGSNANGTSNPILAIYPNYVGTLTDPDATSRCVYLQSQSSITRS